MSIRPVPADIFSQIKRRIKATYAVFAELRLRQLLKGYISTDGKPSLILTRLRSLGNWNCNNEIVKSGFLDQYYLPRHVLY